MRTKSIVLLLLALGCGLVASIGISQIIEQNKQGTGPATETQPILVAMKPITGQEQLKAENVKLEEWPVHLIPKGALTKIEEVEGRRVKFSMVPGDPVLENKLVGDEDRRATIDVPPGFRLVAVHADAVSAVGNLIKPGDRVDVLVYLKANNFQGGQLAGATTILQDIKVFAVNDQWRPSEEKGGNEALAVKNVALLVTPEQAEKVTLATELGKVKLVLRSPDDEMKTETLTGTTPQDLFGTGERSSRGAEKSFLANSGKAAKAKGKGLLGFLGLGEEEGDGSLSGDPLASLAPAATEQFTMQLIEGSGMRSVEFIKANNGKNAWQSGDSASAYQPPQDTPVADLGEQPAQGMPPNPFAPSLGN